MDHEKRPPSPHYSGAGHLRSTGNMRVQWLGRWVGEYVGRGERQERGIYGAVYAGRVTLPEALIGAGKGAGSVVWYAGRGERQEGGMWRGV